MKYFVIKIRAKKKECNQIKINRSQTEATKLNREYHLSWYHVKVIIFKDEQSLRCKMAG